ncbi:MAG: molybdenum cofactor guanylyltransferase [Acidimicrobiales bacterium]
MSPDAPRAGPAPDAGIVLAGGRSSRMASPKAALSWHGSTLLRRVAGIVARSVDGPVVVVASPGQVLPALPAGVDVVCDTVSGKGPLGGIAAGLAAVQGRCWAAYVCSTDVPFLHPAFVARVFKGCSDGIEVCAPCVGGYNQPLAAVYRGSVLPQVEALLAADRRRVSLLFDACTTRLVNEAWLLADPLVAELDPDLLSTHNLNHPEDYVGALTCPEPPVVVENRGRRSMVRASTLGGAALAVGVPLVGAVTLNDAQVPPEPETPLVAGDAVVLS